VNSRTKLTQALRPPVQGFQANNVNINNDAWIRQVADEMKGSKLRKKDVLNRVRLKNGM